MSIYIKRLDVVDSTNRYLRDEADNLWVDGKEIVAVTARHQTAGRGQRGNVWSSKDGENLLLSMLVRLGNSLEVANQFLLSQTVAVSLHAAMKCYGIETRLKWPNDIYVGNRKLAGILVELDYSGAFVEQAIIGIGLNVNQTEFPTMDRVPVSMKMLLGKDVPVDDALASVLGSFERCYRMLLCGDSGAIAREYNSLLLGLGERHRFSDSDGRFTAVIEGVEPTGHLLLRRSDGTLSRYAFKEVEQMMFIV
ncbi:MAG: biotin--[acetyl-CoA-carboxylase] ligase [Bacteroidales bacterium]|nr:biotin--[acetyl-CoA-carboxylase] ligase [Bacteroidales bacterium]